MSHTTEQPSLQIAIPFELLIYSKQTTLVQDKNVHIYSSTKIRDAVPSISGKLLLFSVNSADGVLAQSKENANENKCSD